MSAHKSSSGSISSYIQTSILDNREISTMQCLHPTNITSGPYIKNTLCTPNWLHQLTYKPLYNARSFMHDKNMFNRYLSSSEVSKLTNISLVPTNHLSYPEVSTMHKSLDSSEATNGRLLPNKKRRSNELSSRYKDYNCNKENIEPKTVKTAATELQSKLLAVNIRLQNSLYPFATVDPWAQLTLSLIRLLEYSDKFVILKTVENINKIKSVLQNLPDLFSIRPLIKEYIKYLDNDSTMKPLIEVLLLLAKDPEDLDIIMGVYGDPSFIIFSQNYMRYYSLTQEQPLILAAFKRHYIINAVCSITGELTDNVAPEKLFHLCNNLNGVKMLIQTKYNAYLDEATSFDHLHSSKIPNIVPERFVDILKQIIQQFENLNDFQINAAASYYANLGGVDTNTNFKILALRRYYRNISVSRMSHLKNSDLLLEFLNIKIAANALSSLTGIFQKDAEELKDYVNATLTSEVLESLKTESSTFSLKPLLAQLRYFYTKVTEIELLIVNEGCESLDDFLVSSSVSTMALNLLDLNSNKAELAAIEGSDENEIPKHSEQNEAPKEVSKEAEILLESKKECILKESASNKRKTRQISKSEEDNEVISKNDSNIIYRNGVPQSGRRGVIWHQAGRAWNATWAIMGKQHHKLFYVKDLGMKGALEAAIRFREKIEEAKLKT